MVFSCANTPALIPSSRRPADRGRRAGGVGDALVGAAKPQHPQELVEHDPIIDATAVAAQRMGGVELGTDGATARRIGPTGGESAMMVRRGHRSSSDHEA
jgi:hypothetical protein